MSIENGQRLLRLLSDNAALRDQVKQQGDAAFEAISASVGASATAWEVVVAAIREIEARAAR